MASCFELQDFNVELRSRTGLSAGRFHPACPEADRPFQQPPCFSPPVSSFCFLLLPSASRLILPGSFFRSEFRPTRCRARSFKSRSISESQTQSNKIGCLTLWQPNSIIRVEQDYTDWWYSKPSQTGRQNPLAGRKRRAKSSGESCISPYGFSNSESHQSDQNGKGQD